ncbi:MAG: ABC transporter substrate-binding protein [Deltaproteobacteria bacterium]|jgi:taurine transport system substrate-binding protein|nr:ABC transporter substrate-binding protein [Deltaproteobacteria bacterium]
MSRLVSIFSLTLLALLLSLPINAFAQAKDPITGETYPDLFTVGTFSNAPQTAIPIEEGFFDKLPVKTKVIFFDSGRDINTAFASNSIQAATLGSSPASLGISNKLNYEVIFINNIIGPAESLAVKKSSNIKTLADLKGKKVATPFASTAHYSLLAALTLEKIDPNDVQILDLQTQDILAAWVRGDIDGAYVWTPVLDELLKNDGEALTDSLKLADKGAVTADITVVNKDFAKKYPTLVTAYVEAFIKSNLIINQKSDQAAADLAKHIGIDQAEALRQLKGYYFVLAPEQIQDNRLGVSGKPGDFARTLKETADFHVTQGNLDKADNLSAYQAGVNGSFVQEAIKEKK